VKRGVPEAVFVDNGKVFVSHVFRVACATLGVRHLTAAPYSPQSKYAGLLEAAHRSGLKDLQVKLIQSPNRDNGYTAVCEATAGIKTRSREKVYVEIGDADPASIGDSRLSVHAIGIAATRAKARALRDALRMSICSVEELALGGPQREVSDAPAPSQAPSQDKATEAQLRVLRIQADKLRLPEEDYARFECMTKREASDAISDFNRRLSRSQAG
ncbi:MAG: hypothetical protein PHH46_07955, partial [Firmicutes bacterium]|jgi:hypothetical protein|nr:hypothetical protein [Bacillota bacterium]